MKEPKNNFLFIEKPYSHLSQKEKKEKTEAKYARLEKGSMA